MPKHQSVHTVDAQDRRDRIAYENDTDFSLISTDMSFDQQQNDQSRHRSVSIVSRSFTIIQLFGYIVTFVAERDRRQGR